MRKENIAVFPGSFDPFTNGHVDIVNRASKIFDKVIIAVLSNPAKKTIFSVEERVELIKKEFVNSERSIVVESFSGLLVHFAIKADARVIVRGLRAISDYDYEAQMALMNKHLYQEVETLFMISKEENSYISSSLVKQIALLGGDIAKLVPASVKEALDKKAVEQGEEK